jgi:Tfp pilus assembly protein PilO
LLYLSSRYTENGENMSSEMIVILVLVVIAIVGLGWLELHSRRNEAASATQDQSSPVSSEEAHSLEEESRSGD